MEEELNWRHYLNPEHYDVPLHALRYTVSKQMSLHLDQDAVIHDGIIPNFGGLAELIGFSGLEISAFERAESPTQKLLSEWKFQPHLKPTVGRLIEFLAKLGREDVLTDCNNKIQSEIRDFLNKKDFDLQKAPIQDETVSQGPGYEIIPDQITVEDVMTGKQTNYDAYICFNPYGTSTKDLEFVRELIERFEKPSQYNNRKPFKLFVPSRDDLPGFSAHTISAKIISERCRHMIVVLSCNFLQSEACEFQSAFAHSLSPGARNKRIVPIRIEDCQVPNILRIMACCDFTKKDLWDWSWQRLAKSITVPLNPDDFQLAGESACQSFQLTRSGSPSPDSGFSSVSRSRSGSQYSNITSHMAGSSSSLNMEPDPPKKAHSSPNLLKKVTGKFKKSKDKPATSSF
ncbi:unnamed protein product [Lymnaea stagnalis]|uniref:Myeloid differentiation factor 88 n=1 Tax=Lymnaea stagnalis TaxID=6523 RepID=A0AAV2HE94_LYMST